MGRKQESLRCKASHCSERARLFPWGGSHQGRGDRPQGGALQALKRCKANLGKVQSVLCGSGYTGEPFALGVREALGEKVMVQIARRSALHSFAVMPKRWVVERSFAWVEKNRTLCKSCERLFKTGLQFVHLAFLVLLLRRPRTPSYSPSGASSPRPWRTTTGSPPSAIGVRSITVVASL